jgi:hypothetical protein
MTRKLQEYLPEPLESDPSYLLTSLGFEQGTWSSLAEDSHARNEKVGKFFACKIHSSQQYLI